MKTDKQTERQTNRHVDRQTDRQTYRQTNRETNRQKYRQTNRQTNRQTYVQTDKQTDIRTNRQTNRQTDRQTDRQANRQTVSLLPLPPSLSPSPSLPPYLSLPSPSLPPYLICNRQQYVDGEMLTDTPRPPSYCYSTPHSRLTPLLLDLLQNCSRLPSSPDRSGRCHSDGGRNTAP